MDKINLKEILDRVYDKEYRSSYKTEYSEQCILEAMKEACQETLKLAAENAKVKENFTVDDKAFVLNEYVINKQSILDTINEVE